jgi:hypothetical protein
VITTRLHREERGDYNTEQVIYLPLAIAMFFLVMQFVMFLWADMVVEQTAQHGLRFAATANTAAGEAAMNSYIGTNSSLQSIATSATRTGDTITTRVTATVPSLSGNLLNLTVTGEAQAQVEQFLPPSRRS